MTSSEIDALQIDDVKIGHLEVRDKIRYKWLRQIEFTGYLFFSIIIHVVMLIAGKSLLVAEWIKDRLTNRHVPVKEADRS